MKRSLKYLSLCFALLLVLTGCSISIGSNKDAKEQLTDALKKTNEANSFSAKFNLGLEASAEGQTLGVSLSGDADINLKDTPTAHYNANVSLLGMQQAVEGYVNVKDNKVYTYSKSDNEWTYSTEDYNPEDFSTESLNTLADNAKEVRSVKSDKSGYTKLEVVIDKAKINESAGEQVESLLGSDLKIDEDIVVNVYLKDGYVSIVELDLADLLKKILADEEGTQNVNVTAKITIELSNFGKVEPVTIPQDVINNAKEETAEEIGLDF